ncbi:MAG: prolipoprotein diacylglyceryl transferase [Planctomycetaceae bacterium]|nr:prolipoprotein diacylglyceryl transferase [Planctomycetaceae bacterium]
MNPAYTLIMVAAVATGIWFSRRMPSPSALTSGERLGIGLGAFCGAMIGAKLPFVVADWDGLLSGAAWFSDGKTIICGLVGGYVGVEAAKWALGVTVKTGDSFAVPVAAAVGVGRLACFVGGCCYGTPTDLPWGIVFPAVDSLPRHPTQLYEAAFHLTMAAVLWQLQRRGMFRGQLIKLYILSYLTYRFATEFIRPEAQLWYGLTGYQWACLALAPVFAALWVRDARQLEAQAPIVE